jgi:hypothetical protein
MGSTGYKTPALPSSWNSSQSTRITRADELEYTPTTVPPRVSTTISATGVIIATLLSLGTHFMDSPAEWAVSSPCCAGYGVAVGFATLRHSASFLLDLPRVKIALRPSVRLLAGKRGPGREACSRLNARKRHFDLVPNQNENHRSPSGDD